MRDLRAITTELMTLLLLAFFASCGSSTSVKDDFSSMAPNEGDIKKWNETQKAAITQSDTAKKQPGFDIFITSSLMAALSAVQIKKRSQSIKKINRKVK